METVTTVDKLEADKVYLALPTNPENRSPFLFKGRKREEDYCEDERGIANCWPFDWERVEYIHQLNTWVGVNGNCESSYYIVDPAKNAGMRRVEAYFNEWARLRFREGSRLIEIAKHPVFKSLQELL